MIQSDISNEDNELTSNSIARLQYQYLSDFDTEEQNTRIFWWIKRNSLSPNNFVNLYTNRINVESFVNNDEVYVELQPVDNFNYGKIYQSEIYTIKNFDKPFVSDVKIRSDTQLVFDKINANTELNAYFNFTDVDGLENNTKIYWYDWSKSSASYIYEGSILPAEYVNKNSIISFYALPYNGQVYGDKIESNTILII